MVLQREYQLAFDRLSNPEHRYRLEHLIDLEAEDRFMDLRTQLLEANAPPNDGALARTWFGLASQRIDAMRALSERLQDQVVGSCAPRRGPCSGPTSRWSRPPPGC